MTNDLTGALAEIEAALEYCVQDLRQFYVVDCVNHGDNEAITFAKQALAKCKALREAVPEDWHPRKALDALQAAALLQQFIQEEK